MLVRSDKAARPDSSKAHRSRVDKLVMETKEHEMKTNRPMAMRKCDE